MSETSGTISWLPPLALANGANDGGPVARICVGVAADFVGIPNAGTRRVITNIIGKDHEKLPKRRAPAADSGDDADRCASCGRKLYRGPQKSKCKEHFTYGCNECFTFEEIDEFAVYRAATGKMR